MKRLGVANTDDKKKPKFPKLGMFFILVPLSFYRDMGTGEYLIHFPIVSTS